MTDNAPAGATPVAPGATPGQTPPATPPPAPPATSEPDALGEGGKRAIDAMKAERNAALEAKKAAETELESLRSATATDFEKALDKARKEATAEVLEKANARVRRSEVRAALATAGINPSVIDLAVKADEFANLKVNDDGDVQGLEEAVKAFKTAKADLFKAPATPATADGGTRTTDKEPAKTLEAAIESHYRT